MLIRARRLSLLACLAAVAATGADGCSSEPAATTGTAGSGAGGSGGSAAAGHGGSGGGNAGTGGMVVYGNTCASGVPPGTNCTQGTFSVGTVVHGHGFDAYEGRTVKAAFVGQGTLTATATVAGGAFDFDFLFPSTTCNLGATAFAGLAVFIDVDGDGACSLAGDHVIVSIAVGGPGGTCGATELTPTTPLCELRYPGDADALYAAQTVCPAVGSCFDFCPPQSSGTGGYASICPTGGSGGAGGQGGSSGRGGQGGG